MKNLAHENIEELLELLPAEKIKLIAILSDSLLADVDDHDDESLPDWMKAEILKREQEASPGIPWPEALASVQARFEGKQP